MATNVSDDDNNGHEGRRKLLFSELFKRNNKSGSSSSASTSPFGSELGSAVTDNEEEEEADREWDDDFINELTRQMTDSMLNERDDMEILNLRSPPKGRKNHSESTRELWTSQFKQHRRGKNRERFVANYYGASSKSCQRVDPSSGMMAVFLGRPGLVNGSCGTGVFLPRVVFDPPKSRTKISGCSTVLVPTRVIQLLQLHFANVNIKSHEESVESVIHVNYQRNARDESSVVVQNQETGLPQEWTY